MTAFTNEQRSPQSKQRKLSTHLDALNMPPYSSHGQIHEQKAREANKNNPRCIAVIQTTQLDLWLLRAAKVGVKAVPAFFCPTTAPIKETLIMIDGPDAPLDRTAEKLLIISTWVNEQLQLRAQRAIWRWNFCAPMELKHAMATHKRPALQSPLHSIDDPRFFEIAYENYMCGLDDLSVCVRPWIEAAQIASYPVEFRCFVDASHETVTVSSYYPQRPLPEKWRPIAEATKPYALQLASVVPPEISFSVDFLFSPSHGLLFLEGGPGLGSGAHPCCLNPEIGLDGRVALCPEPGAPSH
jgi:hypothetical protein